MTRRAALWNFLVPGLGYLMTPGKSVQAALFLAYSVLVLGLSAGHLTTMALHWHHLGPQDLKLVAAQVALFLLKHGFVALAVAVDVWPRADPKASSTGEAVSVS